MSLTTVDIAGIDYVIYASVAEADAWLAADPVRVLTWEPLTTDKKIRYLISASRRIDLEGFPGRMTDPDQDRAWPRTGVTCDGRLIAPDEIPKAVERATIILAGSLEIDAAATASGSGPSNIESLKAGPAEVSFFRPTQSSTFALSTQNPDAFALLRCLLATSQSGSFGAGKAFGTGGKSAFETRNSPRLYEGFS